ncbi:xanthine dehydrogenase family protein molybdopterin-binding subunit [Sphingomonas sp.]|uniref:xanthine dehydrogenase family protein molybdopterin-binding subunit n=1 Tax=Sphingomonas sp. TaxID=28214 RepID=UPI003B3A40F5
MTRSYPEIARVDAEDKVRGRPIYAADRHVEGMLYAIPVTATIGKGKVTGIDARAALARPAVRHVLTHEDMHGLQSAGFLLGGGYGFQSIQPMIGTDIAYRGQPVALVVADTLEEAIAGASAIRIRYAPAPFRAILNGASDADIIDQEGSPLPQEMFGDRKVGDADTAFAAAPIQVDGRYSSPPQHQNPMELIATVAEWKSDALIVHEGTQNSGAIKFGLAKLFSIDPAKVTIISPQAGGAFGQKNSMQMQTALAAVAARKTGRPVKLVVPRTQIFHDASFRPASRHRVRLGARTDGKITAAIHEVDQQTSRHDLFPGSYAEVTSRFYAIPNFRGRERLVRSDVQTPGYMRAPYEHPGSFAYESAVDELAYRLRMDPVQLRIINDATADPLTGKPFSSRHVRETLEEGARRFDWQRRSPAPGSMTTPSGDKLGLGVAIGMYKGATAAARANLTVTASGSAEIAVTGHEMGQGIRSAVANYVADRLGLASDKIAVSVGDPAAVAQHLTAGSWGTATALRAAAAAIDALGEQLAIANAREFRQALRAQGRDQVRVTAQSKAPGQPDQIFERLDSGQVAALGPVYPEFVTMSSIAQFVEVHVEPSTRRIRVARVVSVADCGAVASPVTAKSQVRGGVIWGIGATLREASETDPRFGGFLNADLADYVVPVNADIGSIEVAFVDKADPLLNAAGVKGLGEVAMTGVAAAIANAVYHATGQRYRDLPIRLDQMFA